MLRPKVGDLVRLKLLRVKHIDMASFWSVGEAGPLPPIPLSTIDEVIPRALEAGERVTFHAPRIGPPAQGDGGLLLAVDGGEGWVKWDHGARTAELLVNLQREDKGDGK